MKNLVVALIPLIFAGCSGYPKTVAPVSGFTLERYLGTWYEIARLDHRFERGLERVQTTYTLNQDGSIRVLNRGYSTAEQRWQEAEGRARPAGEPDVGYLKVSFFGPFYSSYVIFELDPEYNYAYVSGYNTDYLWLLARSPSVAPSVLEDFRDRAARLGYPVEELILVSHD